MFYLDSQRTLTRRESSVVRLQQIDDLDILMTDREQSTTRFYTDSGSYTAPTRPKGSVEKEIVTMLFESMLPNIIDSWEVLSQQPEVMNRDNSKTYSDVVGIKKAAQKKKSGTKILKSRISKYKMEDMESGQITITQQCWWCKPDEKVVIRFKNGNLYEGEVSMKSMNGSGRFQWANGTVYLGKFKNNEICGNGKICWKDNTWYEGEFVGNLRHGRGLYVDSREQRSYMGQWHCGSKHGKGTIYYSKDFKNSYSGDWELNKINGFGAREYDEWSGYKGEWDNNVIDGKGFMIWPNHDYFKGHWKDGRMSSYGLYIWNAFFNNTMALGSLSTYRGQWHKGERHGQGYLNFGFGLGSHYKGEFKNNKKHGAGRFVTNSGLILQDKQLFTDDNLTTITQCPSLSSHKYISQEEPHVFDMCSDSVGLLYHIEKAISNIDTDQEDMDIIIDDFFRNNKSFNISTCGQLDSIKNTQPKKKPDLEDFIVFEESCLLKAIKCYETQLKIIYFQYANICSPNTVYFPTVLIRFYLWQLYFDCNIHEKGLTLVTIDNIFQSNPEWLSKSAHNPFEEIYYWQFLHGLLAIANKLYAKKVLPQVKPDNILESAFNMFMDNDILPGVGRCKGKLLEGFGPIIPLKGLYDLYRSLGAPHSIRTFLQAVRRPPHDADSFQTPLIEVPDDMIILGENAYEFGDEMLFLTEDFFVNEDKRVECDLKLFNFGNLTSKTLIEIFHKIFPNVYKNEKIIDLEIEITFYEFYEVFVMCAIESIKVKEEEDIWRQKFSVSPTSN